jgi:hypothetical protein
MPGGGRLLAPLIAANLLDDGAAVDARLQTYLRTAALREELRTREYRKICHAVLVSLSHEEIDTIVLQGAALGETAYPRPDLRHSHDIDLLIQRQDFRRAAPVMEGLGFRASGPGGITDSVPHRHVHESQLPLVLHEGLFHVPHHNVMPSEVWERAPIRTILDASVRVLSPADQLVHTCAHAASGWHRGSLVWVTDAWFALASAPHLDWDVVVDRAVRIRAALQVYVTLEYLANELTAPVSPPCLERLRREAEITDRLTREVALFGIWSGRGAKLGRALRASHGWRDRLVILIWRALPSPWGAAAAGRIRTAFGWPAWYLGRPLRFVAGRVHSLHGRLAEKNGVAAAAVRSSQG